MRLVVPSYPCILYQTFTHYSQLMPLYCIAGAAVPTSRYNRDLVDQRRRYLDDDQLLRLVQRHNRILMVDTGAIEISVLM